MSRNCFFRNGPIDEWKQTGSVFPGTEEGKARRFTYLSSGRRRARTEVTEDGDERWGQHAPRRVGRPIAILEYQVADDRLDAQPFLRRQLIPRQLQIHASLACRRLNFLIDAWVKQE